MRAVMLSIQPKWCELIANGDKTVEVRKSASRLETPFTCYMYCTKPRKFIHGYPDGELFRHIDGRIECGFSFQITTERGVFTKDNFLSGKVIGEFICDRIEEICPDYADWLPKQRYDIAPSLLDDISLTGQELWEYGDGKTLYGWHISDLKIYNKPKELGEFRKPCSCDSKIHRPPQSWCYVEEKE